MCVNMYMWCMCTCMHMYVEVSGHHELSVLWLFTLAFEIKTSHWTWWSPIWQAGWPADSCLYSTPPPVFSSSRVIDMHCSWIHYRHAEGLNTALFHASCSTVPVGTFSWKFLAFRNRTFAWLVINLIKCLVITQNHEFSLLSHCVLSMFKFNLLPLR